MTTVALSLINTDNLGDLVSRPHLYFNLGTVVSHDIRKRDIPRGRLYVTGGGAILHKMPNPHTTSPRVAWGVGWTKRPWQSPLPTKLPDGYALIGSRDFGQRGADYVPCASCMSPLFDRQYPVLHDAVLYVNFRKEPVYPRPRHVMMPVIDDLPTLHNGVPFEEAITFLGSGETIITNSYHGAYWGTLLGRKVVIVNPYSTKFGYFKYQPVTGSDRHWRALAAAATVFPEALPDARRHNLAFYEKVMNLKPRG